MTLTRRAFSKASLLSIGTAALASTASFTLAGCDWETTVLDDLPTVVSIVQTIIQVVASATGNGVIGTEASQVLTIAATVLSASITAFQAAVTAFKAAKGTNGTLAGVIAALQSAQVGVQGVINALPGGTIPSNVSMIIAAGIGTVITILSAIQALIPGASPASITASANSVAMNTKIKLPNKDTIKALHNAVLVMHGYGNLQIA